MKNLMIILLMISVFSTATAEDKQTSKGDPFAGVKLRSIGPALMSGRISDVAIDPNNENIWYVGVSSGGVWKTINSGTTWQPVFDEQKVFSIGSVTLDPQNSNRIWVGSRHLISRSSQNVNPVHSKPATCYLPGRLPSSSSLMRLSMPLTSVPLAWEPGR